MVVYNPSQLLDVLSKTFYLLFNIYYSISSFLFHLCSSWLTFCSSPLPVLNFPVLFRNLYHGINIQIDHLIIQSIIMCGRLFPKAFNRFMSTTKQANWKIWWPEWIIGCCYICTGLQYKCKQPSKTSSLLFKWTQCQCILQLQLQLTVSMISHTHIIPCFH